MNVCDNIPGQLKQSKIGKSRRRKYQGDADGHPVGTFWVLTQKPNLTHDGTFLNKSYCEWDKIEKPACSSEL